VNHLDEGRGIHSILNSSATGRASEKNKRGSHSFATGSEMVSYGGLKLGRRGFCQRTENNRVYFAPDLDYLG
jgi:hypothetical protein